MLKAWVGHVWIKKQILIYNSDNFRWSHNLSRNILLILHSIEDGVDLSLNSKGFY